MCQLTQQDCRAGCTWQRRYGGLSFKSLAFQKILPEEKYTVITSEDCDFRTSALFLCFCILKHIIPCLRTWWKEILTVNSPVTASKPTWMVCSKSEGRDISGRSFSFFLFAARDKGKFVVVLYGGVLKKIPHPSMQGGWVTCGEGYSLLSPPGKMERRRTFLFFSSGAIGSGLEAWFNDEESRELLFILKGGAGGFSSISTLSDIFSSTHKVLRWKRKETERSTVRRSSCRSNRKAATSLQREPAQWKTD